MASFSTYAFFQSAVEFPHCSLQHLSWDTTNFVLDSLFHFIHCPWPSRVDPILKVAHKEKSQTDKSGDLGGQGISPNLEMTLLPNNSRTAAIDCLAVLPTVHGCHYAFQKFPFFCVILYFNDVNIESRILSEVPLQQKDYSF